MIVPINNEFRSEVNQNVADEWVGPVIITRGISYDISDADGFVSVTDGGLRPMSGYGGIRLLDESGRHEHPRGQ